MYLHIKTLWIKLLKESMTNPRSSNEFSWLKNGLEPGLIRLNQVLIKQQNRYIVAHLTNGSLGKYIFEYS